MSETKPDIDQVLRTIRYQVEAALAWGVDRLPEIEGIEEEDDSGTTMPEDSPARALEALARRVETCTRCKLHERRQHTVFGEGPFDADLMFVGEGPGADEDRLGRPFVGRAGQLLDKIIVAMGLRREQVYIANVVKCRPPGNRTPEGDEVGCCLPFLQDQIAIIEPRVIMALGTPATRSLLDINTTITRARGRIYRLGKIRVVPTFHPAYLLRNQGAKATVWKDVQLVMRLLNDA